MYIGQTGQKNGENIENTIYGREYIITETIQKQVCERLSASIECQGEQHFTSVEHFGGENNYEKVILNDLKKKKLCEENGIKLLYYTNYKCEESKNMIFDKYKILELL